MTFAVGSLVRARGREWVVLPDSTPELLLVRPLGGAVEETTGIYVPLEPVKPARFDLPDPAGVGDHRSCRLLRDAVRIASRAGAGPFRSFSRIAVEPRPYQLVPLLMALRLDPVRLLIADDVGIGKTIEAGLIARELLDRGEVRRLAVLCPPHLADQWQAELRAKFHIDVELVLTSTAARLERGSLDESLFDLHPQVVVSMDFVKTDRWREEFARTCPELVIVDEAHTCAFGYEARSGRHQRHDLLKRLSADPKRHLILVTAAPHSGKEEAFRSLLALIRPDFADLPDDLSGPANEPHRRRLAGHFVQRRRGDIRHFMKDETPFPERLDREETYRLAPAYRRLLDRVLRYARESVRDEAGGPQRQRVRWWSALALLRSLASSPAAAAETLRNRAPGADAATVEEINEVGQKAVLDQSIDEDSDAADVAPGSDPGEAEGSPSPERRRLLEMAREAEALKGDGDAKLLKAVELVKEFLAGSYRPIVFCRFIPTAEYLAAELRLRLPSGVTVEAVTGLLPPADREARVRELVKADRRVLVCTDCLSEGVNLQDWFDAVMHYDLSWNPTRHEQREGRVDRFGQKRPQVRVFTYYGVDNLIDGIVLDVLIRKHKTIRNSLGISVPVPVDSNAVVEAIFEGLLLREQAGPSERLLPGFEEYLRPKRDDFYARWEGAAQREKRSRTLFAQESIKVDEVARELAEAREASGSPEAVEAFAVEALRACGATLARRDGGYRIGPLELVPAVRDALDSGEPFDVTFRFPPGEGVVHLGRTHPLIEALASHLMETALDPEQNPIASRSGVVHTDAVERRTTLLLLRFRHDILTRRSSEQTSQLAEECGLLAFEGSPASPTWLDPGAAEPLLKATPSGNIDPSKAREFLARVVEGVESLLPCLEEEARRRAAALLEAHQRVRMAAGIRGVSYEVKPQLPADILGIFVLLPLLRATGSA